MHPILIDFCILSSSFKIDVVMLCGSSDTCVGVNKLLIDDCGVTGIYMNPMGAWCPIRPCLVRGTHNLSAHSEICGNYNTSPTQLAFPHQKSTKVSFERNSDKHKMHVCKPR